MVKRNGQKRQTMVYKILNRKINEDFGLEILRGVIKWQNRNREYVGNMFRLYKM